jgi:small subunit ribosomal protein S20
MPNIEGAAKRARQAIRRHARNVDAKTGLKTQRGKLFAAVTQKNAEKGVAEYKAYCSMLDKLAKRGIITKNTAQRRKTRAANRVRGLAAK